MHAFVVRSIFYFQVKMLIKGLDNPTSQLLPIMSHTCCRGTGKEGKTKEVVEDRQVKKWCDNVVYEKCYLAKKDGVYDKVVCKRWCV